MTPDRNIQAEILKRLQQAEVEHDIRIFFACESGSRAWGFASPDSDYDVRFLYVRPRDWYLSFDVERRRDVVEQPIVDDIDCNGWDLRKALGLLAKTNGALVEWLHSPEIYIDDGYTSDRLRNLAQRIFNPVALCYHYSHLARNSWRYVNRERVSYKKYFYALRPLFAIHHVLDRSTPPPVPFSELMLCCPDRLRSTVTSLLERKQQVKESFQGAPIPELNRYIQDELEWHGDRFRGKGRPIDRTAISLELNQLFRAAIETRSPIHEIS